MKTEGSSLEHTFERDSRASEPARVSRVERSAAFRMFIAFYNAL